MGNCGFGVAPTRPEHRDTVVRTLENVEGMSMEALDSGIDWCFETFPEYLAAIDARPSASTSAPSSATRPCAVRARRRRACRRRPRSRRCG